MQQVLLLRQRNVRERDGPRWDHAHRFAPRLLCLTRSSRSAPVAPREHYCIPSSLKHLPLVIGQPLLHRLLSSTCVGNVTDCSSKVQTISHRMHTSFTPDWI